MLPELGPPDAVYLAPGRASGRVSLVYGSHFGLPPAPEMGVSLLLLEVTIVRADG